MPGRTNERTSKTAQASQREEEERHQELRREEVGDVSKASRSGREVVG